MKQYRELSTREIVFEEEAENYVLDKLGIEITPKGKNGTMTQDQTDWICETVKWFFSGNWIEEDTKEAM